jgi:diguanylate cyclase (GGDEF)-like protein
MNPPILDSLTDRDTGLAAGIGDEGTTLRRFGRIAGLLFLAGGVVAIPSNLLHDPPHDATVYLLTLLALASGVICLRVPWHRLSASWLHVVTIAATVEVALAVGFGDWSFSWYYTFIAVYAAYIFASRGAIAGHVGFACLALLAPVAYYSDPREAFMYALVGTPTIVIAAAVVMYLREQLEKEQTAYRDLSRLDPLTGVGNYRVLRDGLSAATRRHRARKQRFVLLVLDLNDFKKVNENDGHLVGDQVLQQVGEVLRDSVRAHDIVVRHGGDEFAVIAPETSESEAAALAVRVERALARIVLDQGVLTACVGWAVFPDAGASPDDLLVAADAELRRDKRQRETAAVVGEPQPTEATEGNPAASSV